MRSFHQFRNPANPLSYVAKPDPVTGFRKGVVRNMVGGVERHIMVFMSMAVDII